MVSSEQRNERFDRYLFSYCLGTFALFCFRDGFTGSLRYYFQMFHISFLWFIPDVLAFGCVLIFTYLQFFKEKNPIGIFFVVAFCWSLYVSALFMNDTLFTLFSSIKMFIPMFVGFCLYERSVTDVRWFQRVLVFIFFTSALGIIANPYVEYPWTGQVLDTLTGERQAARLWWAGGVVRYGGLAGDSTMAGFMTLFTYVMVSPYRSVLFNVLCWPLIVTALHFTDSKTAIGIFSIYVVLYIYMNMIPHAYRLQVIRTFAKMSFVCLAAPPILMITLGGVDLAAIDPKLASLADRINNTWTGPFVWVSDLFPVGLFSGCGIGCYSYPMTYTDMAKYSLPLDNFYMTTFLMMGYPFLIFVTFLFTRVRFMRDPVKISLLLLWNVYSVTVQGYGPSYATLLYGYAISEVFGRIAVRRPSRLSLFPAKQGFRAPEATAQPG